MDETKKIRTQAKAYLTRTANQIAKLLDLGLEHEAAEEISQEKYDFLIDELKTKLAAYDEAQGKYELVLKEEEIDSEIEAPAEYRAKQTDILIRVKEARNLLELDQGPPSESVSSASQNINIDQGQGSWKGANLPKLQLPHFNGDILEFQCFWDKFSALIDSMTDLGNVNKFSYLQSLLRGDARSCLQGLALTEENYGTAKDILVRRFGRKEKIIVAHIHKPLNISSKESLWQIHDQVQVHVRSLANLGVSGANYGLVLTPMILHRLPPGVRLEWARSSEGKEGDVENLLTFLFNEIQRRERSSQLGGDSAVADNTSRSDQRARFRPTGSALITAHEGSARKKRCGFCGLDHFSDKCPDIVGLTHDQRKEKVKSLNMCFKCLSRDHQQWQCSKRCFFCKGPHHGVLHRSRRDADGASAMSRRPYGPGPSNVSSGPRAGPTYRSDDNGEMTRPSGAMGPSSAPGVSGGAYYSQSSASGKATLMQVVTTNIKGGPVTVLFDSGSDFSYVREDTAQKLSLNKCGEALGSVSAFGGNVVEKKHNVYELQLGGVKTTLLSLKTIASPLYRAPVPHDILEQFQDIPITEDLSHEKVISVDILIGLDFYHEFMCLGRVFKQGLVAQHTLLGWMLSGYYPSLGAGYNRNQTSLFSGSHLQPSEATVRKLWELSSIGILGEGQPESESPSQVFENFAKGVSFTVERYCVGLPWKGKDMKEQLLNNESSAQRRLAALDRKLSRDTDLKGKYQEVFVDLENKGMIEEVSPPASCSDQNPLFYLPHRPVVRDESQTTKIRPVFDASAKGENGVSLNDCVEVWPKMIPDLMQILLRFRRWKYGLSADIKKAFLQIELQELDRDVHRFLLVDAHNQVRHMRFKRVTFGIASSPFMLNATIKLHLDKFDKGHTVKELETNLYVDDWLTGSDNEEELSKMMHESTEIMQRGGFPLTKWISNSQKVKEDLKRSFDYHDESQSQKLLGLAWNPTGDFFHFDVKQQVSELYTKRSLLGLIAKQFDPLGLLSPYTISLKILFQEVWRLGLEWDDMLPSVFQDEINRWVAGLEDIGCWEIPRRLTSLGWKETNHKELLVFVDASEKAYGTCIYLTSQDDHGIQQSLVASKVRVAPLKRVTLPRLELLAALLGARLLKFVKEALELPEDTPYTCWTDSTITLAWIQGESSRWKQFVRNRVEEIQSLTSPSNWKHCPGKENPADLLTRGVKASVLTGSTLWLRGPDTDSQVEETQPIQEPQALLTAEELIEFEGSRNTRSVCSVASERSNFIDYERFSSFGKLVRVIALVLKFVGKLRATKRHLSQETLDDKMIRTRSLVIKDLQRRHYSAEIADLHENGRVSRHSSLLALSPFLDRDGLIRIQGRLGHATGLTYDERHPLILPRGHASLLLVRSQHALMKHAGVGTLISSLRSQYWIIGVRSLAKRVVKQCIQCRRYDSRPMDQVTAPLPQDRVTRAPPFSVTGIDHAGPLYCSDTGEKKFYIVLFTCAVTRALHLELVDSLSLDDFILAFRRFVSRRALPSIIYSDNARTFHAASALLQARLGMEIVCWKNICPLSPNWGGWWERLVRSVKSALKRSLGKQSVTKAEMDTLLPEIEACVNSRPLMYTSELGHVLTPSHFLIGRGTPLTSVELENFEQVVNLSERYEFEEAVTEQFWQVWKNEYLRNLPPVTAKTRKTDGCLEEGSLVLIKDEKKPRMLWALGRVIKLYKGIDGKVRAVQLRTQRGTLVRSIQHLCLMEDRSGDPIDKELSKLVVAPQGNDAENSNAGLPTTTQAQAHTQTSLVGNRKEDSNPGSAVTRSGRAIKPREILDL